MLGKAYGGCALKATPEMGGTASQLGAGGIARKNQQRSGWVGHSGSLRNSVQIDIDLPSYPLNFIRLKQVFKQCQTEGTALQRLRQFMLVARTSNFIQMAVIPSTSSANLH